MTLTPETLLRRDIPIPPGHRLRFAFTVEIDVPLGDDELPDGPMSLHEIEEWLASTGRFYSPDDLYTGLRRNYGSNVLDHNAWLQDTGDPLDGDGLRFERIYEQHAREKHDEIITRSRVWLDEIPPSNTLKATDA